MIEVTCIIPYKVTYFSLLFKNTKYVYSGDYIFVYL